MLIVDWSWLGRPRLGGLRGAFDDHAVGPRGRVGDFDGFTAPLEEWGHVLTEAARRGWGAVGPSEEAGGGSPSTARWRPLACARAKPPSSAKLWLRQPARTTRRMPWYDPISPSAGPSRDPMSPSAGRAATAWRTVPRETPQRAASSVSAGGADRSRRSPRRRSPASALGDLLASCRHASSVARSCAQIVQRGRPGRGAVLTPTSCDCEGIEVISFPNVYLADTIVGPTEAQLVRQVVGQVLTPHVHPLCSPA